MPPDGGELEQSQRDRESGAMKGELYAWVFCSDVCLARSDVVSIFLGVCRSKLGVID